MTPTQQDRQLVDLLRGHGFSDAALLASGMEGRVYRVAPGFIAKAWFRRSAHDLRPLQLLYADLRTVDLPLQTPEVLQII